jgi:hypothetical protein
MVITKLKVELFLVLHTKEYNVRKQKQHSAKDELELVAHRWMLEASS